MFSLFQSKALQLSLYLFFATPLLAGSGPALASTTPEQDYGINLTCAALLTTGVPVPEGTTDKLAPMANLYAKRVQTSGKAIGKTPQQIAEEVAGARSNAMTRLNVHDTRRGAAARAEIAKTEQQCAALPIFEAFGHHANTATR